LRFRLLRGDVILKILLAAAALFVIGVVVGLAVELFLGSAPSLFKFGPSFLVESKWQPSNNVFGAWPFIYGTLVTSAIAIVIGFPISLGIAVFITEKLKSHLTFGYLLGTLVDLLAAVPSVIYGLWGVFVLIPIIRDYVERPLSKSLSYIPLFSGHPFGYDFLTAGVILAIMVIPTMSAVTRDVLSVVPNSQREAMYSLGATDWEVTQKSVLPYARSGIFGAFILGLGRAFGETMAVTMVIGNIPSVSSSLFSPGATLSSIIANQFGESSGVFQGALIELGLILFFVAVLINGLARLLLWRMTRATHAKA
jgi:phosphate transport system permease protein